MMAAIAGIDKPKSWETVRKVLNRISHRGDGETIVEHNGTTVGEIQSDGVKMWLGRTGGCRDL